MANSLNIVTKLYGDAGGGYLPAYQSSATWTVAGSNLSSSTHTSETGTANALDVGACTGHLWIEITNLETITSSTTNHIMLSTATGASFSAFAIIPPGTSFVGMKPSTETWYHKATGANQDFQIRVIED